MSAAALIDDTAFLLMEPNLTFSAAVETAVFLLNTITPSVLLIGGVTVGTAVLAYLLDLIYDIEIL